MKLELLVAVSVLILGCTSILHSTDTGIQFKDDSSCNIDSDCKLFLIDWPCESIVANVNAKIVEDKCTEPCSIGASQAFCEWHHKVPSCVSGKCIAKINCSSYKTGGSYGCGNFSNIYENHISPSYQYWESFCNSYNKSGCS